MPWLSAELSGLGRTVHPSVANFILVEFPGPANARSGAEAARAHLSSRGVITREMDGYGLPDCRRIASGLAEDMRAVVAACAEFLSLSED